MEPNHLFLGREIEGGQGADIHYDARDLTTHGVIVGMTGSGKTGLGVIAIEEALLQGIPVLVLDPKGDMGNLLLNFPELQPKDFEPWVNEGDARRKDMTVPEFATKTASDWKDGLSSFGIDGERMRELKDGTDWTIYTPGSTTGVPLNILGSLAAPGLSWDEEAEALRDEIEGFVSSLLGLAGIDSDPISSREHILLANLIEHSWRAGTDLDLPALIAQIQEPPLRKLGVFEVDSFFPAADRTKLAMKLNGLVASPSFSAWLQGPALDVGEMLGIGTERARCAIVSLSHLSDEERQFIVTLLLSKVVTWMRSLSGTTDLRALIYMDEVFGFAPPTAMPPSKKPILTILKQARAFGVGMILSTQNPVDLDYKAMSNAGTWMVGRLQTERDKARLVEALTSASGDVDAKGLAERVGGLDSRQFLLHSTHQDEPQIFGTRWAMSYLRGPLTGDQIGTLMEDKKAGGDEPPATTSETGTASAPQPADDESQVAPEVPDAVPVRYLDPAAAWASALGVDIGGTRYEAAAAARVHLRYTDAKADLDLTQEWEAVLFPLHEEPDPSAAVTVDYDEKDLKPDPTGETSYALPEAPIQRADYWKKLSSAIRDDLYRERTLTLFKNPPLKLYSRPGESRDEFAARCDEVGQAEADKEAVKIRERLEAKKDRLEDAIATARRQLEQLDVDVKARRGQELVAGAGAILSVFLGGKASTRTVARRAGGVLSSASSRRSMSKRTEQRREAAEEKLQDKAEDLAALEQEIVDELAEIDARWTEKADEIEEFEVKLKKSNVDVDEVVLVWVPVS